MFADLEAQTHRRFIKTHTPLDGIPSDPAVTYICVGRDPRDMGLSMDRHIGNTDIGAFRSQRERAAAIDGIGPGPLRPPRPRPGGGPEHWIDPAAFFSRGTSGQWRDLLDDADLARYAARVRALASGSLVEWVHREPVD